MSDPFTTSTRSVHLVVAYAFFFYFSSYPSIGFQLTPRILHKRGLGKTVHVTVHSLFVFFSQPHSDCLCAAAAPRKVKVHELAIRKIYDR